MDAAVRRLTPSGNVFLAAGMKWTSEAPLRTSSGNRQTRSRDTHTRARDMNWSCGEVVDQSGAFTTATPFGDPAEENTRVNPKGSFPFSPDKPRPLPGDNVPRTGSCTGTGLAEIEEMILLSI